MALSNLTVLDQAMKTLIFERYKDYLGLSDINQDIALYPKEVAQRIIAEKRAEATLEFINVWRTGMSRALSRERATVARRGIMVEYTDSEKTDIRAYKAMPVDLSYSIWFWSRDLDKLNAIAESILFWKHQDPNLNLTYDGKPVEYDMLFGDIGDESSIEAMFEKGLYFVYRADLTVQGWVFSSDVLKTVKTIYLKVYDDIDPGGPYERDILLFEQEIANV